MILSPAQTNQPDTIARMNDVVTTCSCCERSKPRKALHALGADVFICRRCGLWVALRLRPDPESTH